MVKALNVQLFQFLKKYIYIIAKQPLGIFKILVAKHARRGYPSLSRENAREKIFRAIACFPYFNIEIYICNKYQITTLWIIYDKLYEPLEMFRREGDEKERKRKGPFVKHIHKTDEEEQQSQIGSPKENSLRTITPLVVRHLLHVLYYYIESR